MARWDVVFFSPYLGPLLAARSGRAGAGGTGGAETQVFLLAVALAARGRRVAVAAFDSPAGLPDRVEGVDVIPLPAPAAAGAGRSRWRALPSRLRLAFAMAARLDGAALVQRAAGSATPLVALIALVRRRRFVYSSANVIDFDFDRLERNPRTVRLFRLGVRLADAVVVQSAEQAELCERAFGRPGHVAHSLAEPAPQRRAEPEAFLWIGRLAPYKRPLAVLDLAERLPEARFWLIGTPSPLAGELPGEVARRAAALDNVELLEPRPRDRLGGLIERAVAMVNTADFEGMPNVFLEGWARGVPALALTHDPDGVIAREGIGWFADGDPQRFAAAASEAWGSRGAQGEIAGRCRRHVERRHGPPAVLAAWEAVLWPGSGGEVAERAQDQPLSPGREPEAPDQLRIG